MRIISIDPLHNGAHENQTITGILTEIPDGYAVIPDDMEIPDTFPFVNIKVEGQTVVSMTAGVVPDPEPGPIEEVRAVMEAGISAACHAAIVMGVDVTLSDGTVGHFSLEETDQINLTTAYNAVQQGAIGYPYHADGQLCRVYPAEDIIAIGDAATAHKLYHTTYCNHLLAWVRRAETVEELAGIEYGMELPEDLATNMAEIMTNAAVL